MNALRSLSLVILALTLTRCGGLTVDPAEATATRTTSKQFAVIDPETGTVTPLTNTETTSVHARGAGMSAPGDSTAKVDTTPPAVELPGADGGGGGGVGGGSKISYEKLLNPTSPLFWLGMLCLPVGGFLIWRGFLIPGVAVLGSGCLVMFAAIYPWLLLVAGVIAAALIGWHAYREGFFREAGRTLFSAAKTGNVLSTVKSKIEDHATGSDVKAIRLIEKLES